MSGSGQIEKVEKNTYIGQNNMIIDGEKDEISCKLNIRKIEVRGQNDSNIVVYGKWDFDFNLKANKSAEKDGVKANIDSISKTSMSFSVTYSQIVHKELNDKWFSMDLYLEVKDDLGNIYKGEDNRSQGDNQNNMTGSTTFGKLDENATKLIITPKMHLSNNGGGVSFDDIAVDLEK